MKLDYKVMSVKYLFIGDKKGNSHYCNKIIALIIFNVNNFKCMDIKNGGFCKDLLIVRTRFVLFFFKH